MFCALNGATLTPRRASARHSPVVTMVLPASDVVPATKIEPCTATSSLRYGHASHRVGIVWRYGNTVKRAIRLAIVDDYAVVIAGVAPFLADERIDVVETGASLPVITDVDIVLYDTFGQVQGDGIDLEDFVRDSGAKVVIYSWNLAAGADRASARRRAPAATCPRCSPDPRSSTPSSGSWTARSSSWPGTTRRASGGAGDWPGRSAGLSPREAEVMALITQGLSNQEIADRAYLSINSVKTYIRSAYRKIGVQRRTQAVVWGVENGFEPDTVRTIDPALRLRPPVQPRV